MRELTNDAISLTALKDRIHALEENNIVLRHEMHEQNTKIAIFVIFYFIVLLAQIITFFIN
jgi:DNA-binding HxlR family transcriptional regulator